MEKVSALFTRPGKFLKTWRNRGWQVDLLAGATVAAIAIPQGMAYTVLARTEVVAGLYAALVAMLVYALFTSTPRMIVGPDTAMSAMAGAAVLPLAGADIGRSTVLVAVLAILIGIFSLIGAGLRLHFLAEFLSRPILLGYMFGIAIVIITDQVPKMLGLSFGGENALENVVNTVSNFGKIHAATLLLSLLLIIVALLLRKFAPKVPSPVILLVLATVASAWIGFTHIGIKTVGDVPAGLPAVNTPSFGWDEARDLLFSALAMALIGFADTVATARSFAAKHKESIDTEAELTALGVANLATGAFGALPVSASGTRTAVNDDMGAHSQWSQIYGALIIGLVLVAFSGFLKYIPRAVLAVIVVLAAFRLFDFGELKNIWRGWRSEAILTIITAIGVAAFGILPGLAVAIFLAILNLVRRSAFPNDAELQVTVDGKSYRDRSRPPKTVATPGIVMYRFDAPLYFGNANFFRDRVFELIDKHEGPVRWFVWDCETITSLDSTAGEVLRSVIAEVRDRRIVFVVARLKGPARDTLRGTNVESALRHCPHYSTLGQAYRAYTKEFEISLPALVAAKHKSH
ncbi:MAG: SulP family inorganic anion transporter [Candidatus Saccharibacteria bacterium]